MLTTHISYLSASIFALAFPLWMLTGTISLLPQTQYSLTHLQLMMAQPVLRFLLGATALLQMCMAWRLRNNLSTLWKIISERRELWRSWLVIGHSLKSVLRCMISYVHFALMIGNLSPVKQWVWDPILDDDEDDEEERKMQEKQGKRTKRRER